MMEYYLAIDLGASGGRHILAHMEEGRMITEEIYRFSNAPVKDEEHLYWDTERLFSEILKGLKRAGELGKIPRSVSIDTWGVDYVLLDKKGALVHRPYCYRDRRTEQWKERVKELIPPRKLFERTGAQYTEYITVFQLYADKQAGLMDSAAHFLMLPDYFQFLLTGVKKWEYTNATTTGLLNVKTKAWDTRIVSLLGLKKELFGEISHPGETVGRFTAEIEKAVGYSADVVLCASHDTSSAVIAAPIREDSVFISSGTWSLLGVERRKAVVSQAAFEADFSNEGATDGKYQLLKNLTGLWLIQETRKELNRAEGKEYSFAELTELALENEIAQTFDTEDALFSSPESMIAAIDKKIGRRLNVGERAYCIFNSLAKKYAETVERLEGLCKKKFRAINIIGGGGKNQLLNNLTAKWSGKSVVIGPYECSAIGNLLLQMIASGAVEDVAAARELVEHSFGTMVIMH